MVITKSLLLLIRKVLLKDFCLFVECILLFIIFYIIFSWLYLFFSFSILFCFHLRRIIRGNIWEAIMKDITRQSEEHVDITVTITIWFPISLPPAFSCGDQYDQIKKKKAKTFLLYYLVFWAPVIFSANICFLHLFYLKI